MAKKNSQSPQLLALASSQAAQFANELVREPVTELRIESTSGKSGKQAPASYSTGRNQALTRGKSGYSIIRSSKIELKDSDAGRGETSAQLLARRLQ
jgi:hypothetical protein